MNYSSLLKLLRSFLTCGSDCVKHERGKLMSVIVHFINMTSTLCLFTLMQGMCAYFYLPHSSLFTYIWSVYAHILLCFLILFSVDTLIFLLN